MLQVARLAPSQLGEAAARVEDYLQGCWNEDGGSADRAGNSDLYYTVFALEGLHALQAEIPGASLRSYLESFGGGDDLDLVHLCCLARCWAALPDAQAPETVRGGIAAGLEAHRSADGGYAATREQPVGTVYHGFLALGAAQDLGFTLPGEAALVDLVLARRSEDGGFANDPVLPIGSTPVTAAAVTLLRQLGAEIPDGTAEWLLAQACADGGFRAAPELPMPDLLSTATALHALAGLQVDTPELREPGLDFVDSLWTGEAFCGHWADDCHDSEYTYYGLLALGHLGLLGNDDD